MKSIGKVLILGDSYSTFLGYVPTGFDYWYSENIHPDNIESKINELPKVAESIVIARDGKLVAIVVVSGELSADSRTALRLSILRSVNAQLPMYAQIYDIEWRDEPLARTAKQTLKRHLYK